MRTTLGRCTAVEDTDLSSGRKPQNNLGTEFRHDDHESSSISLLHNGREKI
jgi:hypothetical protein